MFLFLLFLLEAQTTNKKIRKNLPDKDTNYLNNRNGKELGKEKNLYSTTKWRLRNQPRTDRRNNIPGVEELHRSNNWDIPKRRRRSYLRIKNFKRKIPKNKLNDFHNGTNPNLKKRSSREYCLKSPICLRGPNLMTEDSGKPENHQLCGWSTNRLTWLAIGRPVVEGCKEEWFGVMRRFLTLDCLTE